ncbi:hypothetical protein BDR05DRAFT_159087 [Suillus weaverae]|nr:hypothetical protein BDR05DRAFT_159087 [Suillus weaverae]
MINDARFILSPTFLFNIISFSICFPLFRSCLAHLLYAYLESLLHAGRSYNISPCRSVRLLSGYCIFMGRKLEVAYILPWSLELCIVFVLNEIYILCWICVFPDTTYGLTFSQ